MPSSLQELVRDRVRALPESTRPLLELVAVVERPDTAPAREGSRRRPGDGGAPGRCRRCGRDRGRRRRRPALHAPTAGLCRVLGDLAAPTPRPPPAGRRPRRRPRGASTPSLARDVRGRRCDRGRRRASADGRGRARCARRRGDVRRRGSPADPGGRRGRASPADVRVRRIPDGGRATSTRHGRASSRCSIRTSRPAVRSQALVIRAETEHQDRQLMMCVPPRGDRDRAGPSRARERAAAPRAARRLDLRRRADGRRVVARGAPDRGRAGRRAADRGVGGRASRTTRRPEADARPSWTTRRCSGRSGCRGWRRGRSRRPSRSARACCGRASSTGHARCSVTSTTSSSARAAC